MLTISCEDNMALMRRYPDKHFDLAIVDPPYGIGEAGKNHKSRNTLYRLSGGGIRRRTSTSYTKKDWDSATPSYEFFRELKRVSKNQIIFGANYFTEICGTTFKPPRRPSFSKFIQENGFSWIIWDKINGTNDFNDCELAWHSFPEFTTTFEYMWAGMMQGKGAGNGTIMNGDKSKNEKRIHPTQKPVILYKWLLDKYAAPGDKIIDTHFGGGSIGLACYDYDFDLTACELDEEYFNKAMKRIDDHKKQQRLILE